MKMATNPNEVKFKILLVDHECSSCRQGLVDILTTAGFNVDWCSDFSTAYRKLKNSVRPVDLLIIDPACSQGLEGHQFLRLLRQDFPANLKIIITTDSPVSSSLLATRNELSLSCTFNKSRPVEELFCIVTDLLPPGGPHPRRFRRIPVRFLVGYSVGSKTEFLYAANLSQEGMFLRNKRPDPVGTIAKLSFRIPGKSTEVQAKALVIRVFEPPRDANSLTEEMFPAGNGLKFIEMSGEHRAVLKEVLEREEARLFGLGSEILNFQPAPD